MDLSSRLPQCLMISLLLLPGLVSGASSINYRIGHDVLDNGGGPATSTNYQLRASSMHPHALGAATSPAYRVYGGLISLPDSDGDTHVDPFDNCPVTTNTNQVDTDGDGVGDACDSDADGDGLADGIDPYPNNIDGDGDGLVDGAGGIVLVSSYSSGIDADGDGFVDGEQDFGTSATNPDSDSDGFDDGTEVYFGSDPMVQSDTPANGDVNEDGAVNVADVLLVTRHVLGQSLLDTNQQVRADVAPLNGLGIPTPDGNINAGDLLRIQQMAIQQ